MSRARRTRRLLVLASLAGGAALVWRRRGGGAGSTDTAPSWPPIKPSAAAQAVTPPARGLVAVGPVEATVATATQWMAPVAGECPDGYPVKANNNSGIYHVPGGRFYARTVPERCYATPEAAEADGYRRAKS